MSDSDPNKRGANLSAISRISLFIDDNKQVITYGLYTLGFAGLIKIGGDTSLLVIQCLFVPEKSVGTGDSLFLHFGVDFLVV